MPHSALQSGQYRKWRTGKWQSARMTRTLSVDFGFKAPWDLEKLRPNSFFPVPASVAFAQNLGLAGNATPLSGNVEQWLGQTGTDDVLRVSDSLTDASGGSPYANLARNGATIFPRVLFFVNESENPAIIQAGNTVTVNPRRGVLDKSPWKDLDLDEITGQTIERDHLFNIHLGETVAPYVTLEPLQALLPLKQDELEIPISDKGIGGVRLGGLERRMRGRWRIVSELWEDYRAQANKLNLLEQLDYMGKMSSQLHWQLNSNNRPVRVIYTSSGQPTAAILYDDSELVENLLFWIPCKDINEANYLLAIINSAVLYNAVSSLMPKGQFGARHLHKHLWKLPIPEYKPVNALHREIAKAGEAAAAGAANELENLRLLLEQAGKPLTVTSARKRLRNWLKTSEEGRAVESAVGRLLP